MRGVVRALVTLLVAWLGLLLVAPAEPALGASRPTYTNTSANHSASPIDATTQRGPPAVRDSTYGSVKHGWNGASARPDRPIPASATDYDYPGVLLQVARATPTTAAKAQAADGCSLAFERGSVAANTVDDGVSLSLRYKAGWSAAQRSAADAKVAALNDAAEAGALRVTPVQRSGTSAASRYRSAGGTIPRGADVDHTIDLQLGGLDDIANMSPLDLSVNRSLGSQIMWQLRGVELGTCVIAVGIC